MHGNSYATRAIGKPHMGSHLILDFEAEAPKRFYHAPPRKAARKLHASCNSGSR